MSFSLSGALVEKRFPPRSFECLEARAVLVGLFRIPNNEGFTDLMNAEEAKKKLETLGNPVTAFVEDDKYVAKGVYQTYSVSEFLWI
jgi:hypothetical protein